MALTLQSDQAPADDGSSGRPAGPSRSGVTQRVVSTAHHYQNFGWLSRLGRGVFMFPNDTLREQDCLKFLARQLPGLHVEGKTALAWRGVRHNLAAHEPLWLSVPFEAMSSVRNMSPDK